MSSTHPYHSIRSTIVSNVFECPKCSQVAHFERRKQCTDCGYYTCSFCLNNCVGDECDADLCAKCGKDSHGKCLSCVRDDKMEADEREFRKANSEKGQTTLYWSCFFLLVVTAIVVVCIKHPQ